MQKAKHYHTPLMAINQTAVKGTARGISSNVEDHTVKLEMNWDEMLFWNSNMFSGTSRLSDCFHIFTAVCVFALLSLAVSCCLETGE